MLRDWENEGIQDLYRFKKEIERCIGPHHKKLKGKDSLLPYEGLEYLICQLLQYDPKKRFTAQKAHEYMRKFA